MPRTWSGSPVPSVGAALAVLLGNPLSGLTSAPELLPSRWGTLGLLLPPGAAGSTLRSVAFFGGAGAATPAASWGAGSWSAWCCARSHPAERTHHDVVA